MKLVCIVGLMFAVACNNSPHIDPVDAPPGPDAAITLPVFRNPVDLPDLELAHAAATRLGVNTGMSCDQCHGLTRGSLQRWLVETRAADACITLLAPTVATSPAAARGLLDCFRTKGSGPYDPHRLGVYATAATLGWFDAVIQLDYGSASGPERAEWRNRVAMPRGGQPALTQAEFDIVAEWFARGLPQIDAVVSDTGPVVGCTPMVTAAVGAHVTAMQTAGWTALNRTNGISMLGCGTATDPLDCLDAYPLASADPATVHWTDAAPLANLRILRSYAHDSSFWTRSSADGRFVAHGGGSLATATIIDLQGNREIGANASYDPGFFPDNSGFVIQGGTKPWCRQSLLTSNPTQVTFTEPECSEVSVVGLYQHLGAMQGGDYWAVNGQFISDSGGGEPSADFGSSGYSDLTPMMWTGTSYEPRPAISIATPYEGDTTIAPSAKLLISRTSFMNQQAGFTLRKLDATPAGSSYTVDTPVIARYCMSGGKPAFSYDERWLVYHHWVQPADWTVMGYTSATDPEFVARLNGGTANVFLLDLTTGVTHRITNMNAGQSALFPHFRSDGWIYFVVKDTATPGHEKLVASDAALR